LERFTGRADAYAAARPSYPSETIAAIVHGFADPAGLTVADLGAGTGISSRLLAATGAQVVAVEPNAAMRSAAAEDPRLTWIAATAEATTLADRSVDIVTAFQAWHWVDHALAIDEVRRILRPGGRFAVVYNERDGRDPFTAGYGDIVRRYARDGNGTERDRETGLDRALAIDPPRTRRLEFPNVHALDRAGVHRRAESTSYLPRDGPAYEALHRELDELVNRFTNKPIEMHLTTILVTVDFP
jgi:SAM-dependent methyltransferase